MLPSKCCASLFLLFFSPATDVQLAVVFPLQKRPFVSRSDLWLTVMPSTYELASSDHPEESFCTEVDFTVVTCCIVFAEVEFESAFADDTTPSASLCLSN